MKYLHPWFVTLPRSQDVVKRIMEDFEIDFDDEWVYKASVVGVVNTLCERDITQKQLWQAVYDSRKSLPKEYDFLFLPDPEFKRNRTWCHMYEAWYAIALACSKYQCLHKWLRHFYVTDDGHIRDCFLSSSRNRSKK